MARKKVPSSSAPRQTSGSLDEAAPAPSFLTRLFRRHPTVPWLLATTLAFLLCLPPFEVWPLAFVALTGYAVVARFPERIHYRSVWLIALFHWMITFHFIRLPHWAGWFGILLIAGYAALYDVAFLWLIRRLTRKGWPLLVSAPLAWTGVTVVRSTILSGIPIGILGHALYRQPQLIQIADLAGELGVSALLVITSVAVADFVVFLLPNPRFQPLASRTPFVSTTAALILLIATLAYGRQTSLDYVLPNDSGTQVALIQGSQDVQFGLTPEEARSESAESYRDHRRLTIEARQRMPDLAAAVWPESMFPALDVLPLEDEFFTEEQLQLETQGLTAEDLLRSQQWLPFQILDSMGVSSSPDSAFPNGIQMIVGMRSFDAAADRDYNAAVQFDSNGQIENRYFKTHLVPFGEFLPLGEWFPQLYQFAPMPRALSTGNGAHVFTVQGKTLLPTVCYESVIGWHVRDYLLALNDNPELETPKQVDALLNISNDGWFWGSSALDLHLASNVFRAVENRTLHLVACNTGISTEIQPNGEIRQEAGKRTSQFLIASVADRPTDWRPVWWTVGNTPWWLALVIVLVGAWLPTMTRRQNPKQDRAQI